MLTLVTLLLAGEPRVTTNEVPCQTVQDCWLDATGKPIARPKKFKGQQLPVGDCGAQLHWLRHRLTCSPEQHVCVAELIGDRC
jgi:hypothetical protein